MLIDALKQSKMITIQNADILRASPGLVLPEWLDGTPTLVNRETLQMFRGSDAVEQIALLANAENIRHSTDSTQSRKPRKREVEHSSSRQASSLSTGRSGGASISDRPRTSWDSNRTVVYRDDEAAAPPLAKDVNNSNNRESSDDENDENDEEDDIEGVNADGNAFVREGVDPFGRIVEADALSVDEGKKVTDDDVQRFMKQRSMS